MLSDPSGRLPACQRFTRDQKAGRPDGGRDHHRLEATLMSSPIETALREALLRMAPAQYILVDGTGYASAIPEKWGDFDNVARWITPIILLDEPEHKRAI